MAQTYKMTVGSSKEAAEIVGRFDDQPLIGPMRSPRAEIIARSVASLAEIDPDTAASVPEPITPIDPFWNWPDFDNPIQGLHVTTSIEGDAVIETFEAHHDDVIAAQRGQL